MKRNIIFALLIVCILLCGCGQQRYRSAKSKQEQKKDVHTIVHKDTDSISREEPKEKEVQPKEVIPDADAAGILFELEEPYTGYLDELTKWQDCVKFANQDYDGDGVFDRVRIETTDSEENGREYQLTILLSGGEEIVTDSYSIFFDPIVYSLDMDRDGVSEIVVQLCSLTSSAPLFADLVEIYRKSDDGYERPELPFDEDNSIVLRYKKNQKALTVMNPDLGFIEPYEQISEQDETWNQYLDVYDGGTEKEWVYIAGVKNNDAGDRLLCMCQAFDKWSGQGIVFEMYWDRDHLAIENGEKIVNVYELNPANSPTWDKVCGAY